MELAGSCHCGLVKFKVTSHTPRPYMYCYCSICRKTNGGAGAGINIMGDTKSLDVEGICHVRVYQVVKKAADGKQECGHNLRHFCGTCGTHLWNWSPRYTENIYPCASAIDTPLPPAPERAHIMLGSRASWVEPPPASAVDRHFEEYPDRSILAWHTEHGLLARQADAPTPQP